MKGLGCDIAIIGGGLAGGLIALALAQRRPDLATWVLEAGEAVGGNHRWSWFHSDIDANGRQLLAAIDKVTWNEGYAVAFPGHSRILSTPYRSMHSRHLAAAVAQALPPGALWTGVAVTRLDEAGATLADGTRIEARTLIDCRGLAGSPHLAGGYQVFMGRHLHLRRPHGLTRPVIMDATVEQAGGYRFVYVLPLGASDIFVEDTYYQDGPGLDRRALSARIDAYCAAHGWEGVTVGSETGVLPVITNGDFAAFQHQNRTPGVAVAGVRGGFVHPLTSYSLPFAVGIAQLVAANADLPGERLATLLEERARDHWQATRFYRLLGAMLFGAARPEERYRVFARFYRLSERLIERFYAARSTPIDCARILLGRPPVPISRAIAALAGWRPPLALTAHGEMAR